jgi:hypothetical protein
MFSILFDINWIIHKEFVLVGKAVNCAYYCDVLRRLLENARRLRTELWRQKNWLLHHNNALSHTSFLTREFFTKSNMTTIPHSPYSSDLAPCDLSVSRHFYALEVIEAKSLALLSTLTEHDFQDVF